MSAFAKRSKRPRNRADRGADDGPRSPLPVQLPAAGAGAGGGLMLSLGLPVGNGNVEAADADGFAPTAFIRIGGDGQIVLTMPYVKDALNPPTPRGAPRKKTARLKKSAVRK
jgi:hypothetical protein